MELQRIECSQIITGNGCNPARIVIAKRTNYAGPQGQGYCTHVEILEPNQEPYLIWGHYDMTLDEALHDYQRRIEWLIGKPRKGERLWR